MNLALSDEQVFLREAARGALSRFKTLEAAREALDGDQDAMPDLWPTAREAGWPGLLIDEAHGGAGLDAFDAMLVLGECGRVLASVPLLGHLPATAILGDAPSAAELMPALATGERRAAYLPAQPPTELDERWTTDPASGAARGSLPSAGAAGEDGRVPVTGSFAFV
ncbi:MAG TPA: acyl-CoA dehydrogenase family protein, partial [Solirubrobacteraceae bacterium]|nr:acyl-CoA dehydrogenase family protein [Solirubrobacteraceae bacterium]